MGCWLKAKSGVMKIRDGRGFSAEMKTVGNVPVWFENLEPETFENDTDVKVCPAPKGASPEPVAVEKEVPASKAELKPPPAPVAAKPEKPAEPPPATPTKGKGGSPSWAKDT